MDKKDDLSKDLINGTSNIVAGYMSTHQVHLKKIPELIELVYNGLYHASSANRSTKDPAVPIEHSIKHDHIVCLEDGKKLKMLRRYLKTKFNLTPEEYIEKWGLPSDYPMIAPSYSKKRSKLAKETGLGK